MATILDGRKYADLALDEVAGKVQELKKQGVTPGLAVILVGDDPASQTYVRSKGKACDRVGIYSRTIILPEDTKQQELEKQIAELNRDEQIDGILLQLPLPRHLDEQHALSCIAPEKDVDGFHALNAGRPKGFSLCSGRLAYRSTVRMRSWSAAAISWANPRRCSCCVKMRQ